MPDLHPTASWTSLLDELPIAGDLQQTPLSCHLGAYRRKSSKLRKPGKLRKRLLGNRGSLRSHLGNLRTSIKLKEEVIERNGAKY
jgi:hypothetical protein